MDVIRKLLNIWNRYEKIDGNSIASNDIPTLKTTKYNYIHKAKNIRDSLIISNAIVLMCSILVSFITISFAILNGIYDKGKTATQRIDDIKIEIMKVGIDEKDESELATIKSDMQDIYEKESQLAIKDINSQPESVLILIKIIIYLIVGIFIIYLLPLRRISCKASYYETLVIMIDERIKEIESNTKQKENDAIKKLDEIDKTVDGTKREVETLIKVFSSFQK